MRRSIVLTFYAVMIVAGAIIASRFLTRGIPELVRAVEAGEMAVSAAADISNMTETEQREMVASILSGAANADAKVQTKKSRKLKTRKSRRKKHVPPTVAHTVPAAEIQQLRAALTTATERLRQLEEELERARAGASTAPSTYNGIPAFLDRRLLSAEDKKAFRELKELWAKDDAFRISWANVSSAVRYRFVHNILLAEAVS